ncbi:nucleoside deaminase [Tessaracoccus rhinocerotis]|uniref:Nucleoside deaminase n=1 Tax=Tessaracoccus rhinocerotis TaxID=1689449 RepID=A0A553K215_9ACTN|nr:nucleoside deaminase [Tessaracoccus rhinocerotis]
MSYGGIVSHLPPDPAATAEDAEHARHLQHAVTLAARGLDDDAGGPFGAVVVLDGEVVAEGWNQVTSTKDPTAHAEIVAIREACAKLADFQLHRAVVYASCEPCPMCLGAIYWARPSAVFFATTKHDAERAGFSDAFIYEEIDLPHAERSIPFHRIEVEGGTDVFDAWLAKHDRTRY